MTTESLPYEEKHWLQYGTDYTVTDPGFQNTGGMLTLLKTIPGVAEQLVIRRVTQRTQEIDLHNGAKLPAELIESMSDKATMQIQELAEQSLTKDDRNKILQAMSEALAEATTAVYETLSRDLQTAIDTEAVERINRDIELTELCQDIQQEIGTLQTKNNEFHYLAEYLILLVESKFGPLSGAIPLITAIGGDYLVTENDDFLIVALNIQGE